ncbi:MAG: glycosyltransferase [Actinomycetota bacterium]
MNSAKSVKSGSVERANRAFRENDYELALRLYEQAISEYPEMSEVLSANVKLTHTRLGMDVNGRESPHAAKLRDAPKEESLGDEPGRPLIAPRYRGAARSGISVPVTVIVPIYNALDDAKACLERLNLYTAQDVHILLIDDASPDPRVQDWLRGLKQDGRLKVVFNEKNQGFTRTVNRGLELAEGRDVVILNSDARVTPRWLEGLREPILRDDRVGTVTPMSDRAGAFSAPKIGNDNDLPLGVSEAEYAVSFRRSSGGHYPVVPTGNGFCMYIRRACLDAVGAFDVDAFPRGYGEENDFCMRAGRSGWRNVIDDRTYVFHSRSKSFGDEKDVLMSAGRSVINSRYPDYSLAVKMFRTDPLILDARARALQALEACRSSAVAPRVLFVTSTKTGGTPQTNGDLMRGLSDTVEPWHMRCDSKRIFLYKVTQNGSELVEKHKLTDPVDPLTHRSREYDEVVADWLYTYDFAVVHIRHLAWHSLSLPRLAKASGAKTILSFHDYYALCPTVKLVEGDGSFCAADCAVGRLPCTPSSLWPLDGMPPLRNSWVLEWRRMFREAAAPCDAFVTTSESARELITEVLALDEGTPFHVIPHGRDFPRMREPDKRSSNKSLKTMRILLPGNIDVAKGGQLLKEVCELDTEGRLEFHILGKCEVDVPTAKVQVHGQYQRDEFVDRALRIKPDVGVVLSIWDETWCHTLTELWAAGLPVAALDYPTVASRVEAAGGGWISERTNSQALYELLIGLANEPLRIAEASANVADWQQTDGILNNVNLMSARYLNVYKGLEPSSPLIGVVSPANDSLTRAPGSTHVRVWEKTKNALDRRLTFLRLSPELFVKAVEKGYVSDAIIQRNALSGPLVEQVVDLVEAGQLRFTYDLDDDLLDVPAEKDPTGSYRDYRASVESLLRAAQRVLASTPTLVKVLSRYSTQVELEENSLNARTWLKPEMKPGDRKAGTLTKFLYFGSQTHAEDFALISPIFDHFYDTGHQFKVKVLGGFARGSVAKPWLEHLEIPNDSRDYPAFVEFLKRESKDCAWALAPLSRGRFNQSKSPLKLMEYAALGLPVMASRFGPYEGFGRYSSVVELGDAAWAAAIGAALDGSVVSAVEAGDGARALVSDSLFNAVEFDSKLVSQQ